MSHVISWESSLLIISHKTIFLRFGGFMNQLLYIVWNPDLVAFRLGPLSVRWYGLMWSIGIVLAFLVVKRLYKEQKIKDELFAPLYIYCFFGILIGARLGSLHLLSASELPDFRERHHRDAAADTLYS